MKAKKKFSPKMIDVVYNGKVHYRRPENDPELAEIACIIARQQREYGKTLYELRESPANKSLQRTAQSRRQCSGRRKAAANAADGAKPPPMKRTKLRQHNFYLVVFRLDKESV